MALSFPASPTSGDTHTTGGQVWTFNGSGWTPPAAVSAPSPSYTPINEADKLTPTQLTFRAVHHQRSRNPLPGVHGPLTPCVEEFAGSDLFENIYTVTDDDAAPTSATIASGVLTLTGNAAGGSNRWYAARTRFVAPHGVFAAVKVEPGFTGEPAYACAGFGDPATGDYVEANWRLDTGALNIFTKNTAGNISVNVSAGTLAGPTDAPVWVGLVLNWPSSTIVTSLDGESWTVQKIVKHTRTNSLNIPAQWAPFRPFFRVAPISNSGVVKVSGFRAGYAGALGYLNQRMVTYADGTPYVRDGKYFLTATIANAADFYGQHMAVLSMDPTTYTTELIRHVYFDWNSVRGGASVGTCVYDEDTGIWHVVAATWGFGSTSDGIDQIYATTRADLMTPGVSVLEAATINTGSENSVYDAAIRREAGTWHIAAIETDARTGWSTHQPRYYTASDLGTWTLQASDNVTTDGTQWCKIGGTWYIVGGGSSGFYQWSATLTNRTNLTTWSSAAPAGLVTFSTFPAHPGIFVIDDEYQTRYVLSVYDASKLDTKSGTRGGNLILEADEKPAGQEHAPKYRYPVVMTAR